MNFLKKLKINIYKGIDGFFFQHPREKNMSYLKHCLHSLTLSFNFTIAAFEAFVHALVPRFFETSSTDNLMRINVILNS